MAIDNDTNDSSLTLQKLAQTIGRGSMVLNRMQSGYQLELPDLTGNFITDYNEACKKLVLNPMKIQKIGHPLPPLPTPVAPLHVAKSSQILASGIDMNASQPLDENALATVPSEGHLADETAPGHETSTANLRQDLTESTAQIGSSHLVLPSKPTGPVPVKYNSRYRFTPTIDVELSDNEDEEEIYKLEVRGWRLDVRQVDVIACIMHTCTTITHLTLWNNGLDEAHFASIVAAVHQGSIRHLVIDQNPAIPEQLYAFLVIDDSALKTLCLRGNRIGDPGAKSLASVLKSNRTLQALNLWDNRIGKEGAGELAEVLKFNSTLMSLSLGHNNIGDEGAAAFAKVLSNYPLHNDEIMSRKKALAEIDKQRKEQEEDQASKKTKGRLATSHAGRVSSANQTKKADEPAPPKGGPQDKNAKKGAAPAPAKAAGKKGAETSKKEEPKSVAGNAGAGKGGKGGEKAAVVAADEKSKGKDAKKTAAAAAAPVAKGGKKGKAEEIKEDVEETGDSGNIEPMFEVNGQWFILGNRTLNNLNLSRNSITAAGLKAILDAVVEQESTAENMTEGIIGVFRVSLQDNVFEASHPQFLQLQTCLKQRNPFYEHTESDNPPADPNVILEVAEHTASDSHSQDG
ncbi:uncharacterized protein BJ171DRAFT_495373 [Polychytrium aggregatum]|uniref:uncharacterized protein n=1 Tax=Polychytrium aggregatum TaxID=110093 RepID=UPI0022FE3F4B|nr:uncharacterized protein BJ171DRAFT_495373 [Polychytrium aggregatum]KAI9206984.1 hypothetical protein BJ171DRAFT_495373 [Polychytrium aggregatum]